MSQTVCDVEVEVEVEDQDWCLALENCEAVARRAAEAALARSTCKGPMAVTVLLTDDDVVQDLNARFRDKDKATNVLSFPAAASARPHLGDVALAYGVCAAEAQAQGKSLSDHLSHLTVHGVLHLLGYDHEAENEAEVMEDMERAILNSLGVSDPYAQGPDA